ncbi:ATP-binding protein [Streptomyces gamaensis]|uniref:histidine kinase n=1 Tax=Streptomyces gamaensis TaxID=1763542 RepID=A0ABW0YX72_9ACTN
MGRSMRRLRRAASDVAENRLPALVGQLSRTDPGHIDTRVQPIPITTKDEIGEIARAFDQIHREAVRLAAEQALLRGNINAIFTNLSRRNQSLIEGQLTLITELEEHEADPDQLENLFRLDHLATRMRRNGENLLVLAGEEAGRRWDQPVPLVDVLRAASSEVEAYERIELSGVPDADIHGLAVTDLVHLLAELLENATTFSSPHTKVRVTATRLPDGRVMVEIHDKGIGLTAEDFADINHKLANPPTVDVAVAQRMGLFVVGRLAARHGIRVQLRPSGEQAGTTSLVMLPDAITHGGGGEDEAGPDDFTVSPMVPGQKAAPVDRMRTAAELGFDDSRYDRGPESANGALPDPLDPLGRARLREERRSALEAQAAAHRADFGRQQEYERQEYEQQGYPQPDYEQQAPQGYGRQLGYEQQQAPYGQQHAPLGEQQLPYDQPQSGGPSDRQSMQQPMQQDVRQDVQQQGAQPSHGYPQAGYPEAGHADAGYTEQQTFGDGGALPQQGDWQGSGPYQSGLPRRHRTESESLPPADTARPERVEFDRPSPAPSGSHSLTGAGLPRRGTQWQQPESVDEAAGAGDAEQPRQDVPQQPHEGADRRAANDERWHRAEQLRDPKAGGVTPSGLPRRVPKANLIEGTAAQTAQNGPQISRAPEDVRGRLSNLRRGVQQGRSAGTESAEFPMTSAQEQHEHNDRGPGPGGTYDQER